MIRRVFIANRGEIALRILRACRELGLETVCPYTQVDADQPYLEESDACICIGERDYLHKENLLMAARNTGCDAIHPGYGFYSENAEFASAVQSLGMKWVGPSVDNIRAMADKVIARDKAAKVGLRSIPGTLTPVVDANAGEGFAQDLGYPLLIKAALGGGGRGIHKVVDPTEFSPLFQKAKLESSALFEDDSLYLEKYLEKPRHVEIQVLGDGLGQVVHLGSRDCSLQRRHQKLVEEAPAPFIDEALLEDIADQSIALCRSMAYEGVGTLEFLYVAGEFYFIEMNTRLQVEHPVTEMITGVDIVKAQLLLAGGEKLSALIDQFTRHGHAIECRINAEDEQFMPSPGIIESLRFPGGPGVRIDSHLSTGSKVSHHYDSLIAKIVTWGSDRTESLARMSRALDEFHVSGVATNKVFLSKLIMQPEVRKGLMHTQFVEEYVLNGR